MNARTPHPRQFELGRLMLHLPALRGRMAAVATLHGVSDSEISNMKAGRRPVYADIWAHAAAAAEDPCEVLNVLARDVGCRVVRDAPAEGGDVGLEGMDVAAAAGRLVERLRAALGDGAVDVRDVADLMDEADEVERQLAEFRAALAAAGVFARSAHARPAGRRVG